MPISSGAEPDWEACGREAYRLAAELFPLCRSITGEGARETLRRVAKSIPLELVEVPSGRKALDWEVPQEWNIRSAWLKAPGGKVVCDFRDCNLHVLGYSAPVSGRFAWRDLEPHLFSSPRTPDWVPYLTSYFRTNWGFCLADRVLKALPREGEYEVHIDSTLGPGSLSYGEAYLPPTASRCDGDVLISAHTCHPSLANDNLSGIAVAAVLHQVLASRPRRFGYRFLFLPATIGPIVWLSGNEAKLGAVHGGLVLSGLGDSGGFTYKRSRRGDAAVDRVAAHVLRDRAGTLEDFSPYGYDERQYCSPGYDLPVGRLSRTPFGTYPQYHTSADDLSFISACAMGEAVETALRICEGLEWNRRYRNLSPKGEPQLGRRGLYGAIGGRIDQRALEKDLLWVLNWSDGGHGLLDIATKAGEPLARMAEAARLLEAAGLLEELA